LAGADWSGFKAYQREIEVLQQLKHPRIPRYLDCFETPQGFCLVQEYKNALSLAVRRSFTLEDIKQIALSVLEILVYLQRRVPPIIHRDIKPENILVDKQLNAYLVDFGFARIRGGQVAVSSLAAGTPGFMPPEEQFGRPLTEASDLYSLGATLIGLLTGTRSVDIGQLMDDNYRFVFKEKVPQLSPRFVQWLTKLVEPNLKNRYANAAVALEALKPIPVVGSTQSRKAALVVGLASLSIILLGKTWIFPKSETAVHTLENTKPNPKPSFVTPTPEFQKASSDSNKAVPFRISSMNGTGFAMVGTFNGNYYVYPDFIKVSVTKGTIYLRDSAPYKGHSELNSVTFELGGNTPQGWDTVNKSQSIPVNKVMKPGDTYTFNDTHFFIPRKGSTELSKRWFIVQMESTTLDGEYAGVLGHAYAHSRRTIFSEPDTTVTPLVKQLLATKKCPGCNLQNANLNDSNLVGASLSQSNLERAKLLGANLQNANLHKANLKRVYLRSSNLKGANLQDANLEGAYVSNAQLQGANLKGANLKRVRLVTSNLEGANLEGANLLGADLVENTKLHRANLKGATMPDGSRHE